MKTQAVRQRLQNIAARAGIIVFFITPWRDVPTPPL